MKRLIGLTLLLSLLLAGCSSLEVGLRVTATPTTAATRIAAAASHTPSQATTEAAAGGASPTPSPTNAATPSPTLTIGPPASETASQAVTATTPPATRVPRIECTVWHTVQAGEYLLQIARLYGVDWHSIAEANNISDPTSIRPGQVLCVPGGVPPTPTPPPATPTATVTPSPAATLPGPFTFAADRTTINPGESVTLRWSPPRGVTGTVSIALVAAHGTMPGQDLWRELPLSGTLTVTPNVDPRGRYLFRLSPSFAAAVTPAIPLRFPCPDTFFFTFPAGWPTNSPPERDRCPEGPASYPAAVEQVFEGGRMVWLQSDGRILILYGDGGAATGGNAWESVVDTWTPAEPESDPAIVPPEGRYQPVRGFGKVWRLQPGVRERLGWALRPEQSFAGADQRDWEVPGTDSLLFRYLRTASGGVIGLTEYTGHGVTPFWVLLIPQPAGRAVAVMLPPPGAASRRWLARARRAELSPPAPLPVVLRT